MSLIDDALRRVNDPTVTSISQHPGKAVPPVPPAAPAQPVPDAPPAHSWQARQPCDTSPAAPRTMHASGIGIAIAALCVLGSVLLYSRHMSARNEARQMLAVPPAPAPAQAAPPAPHDVQGWNTREGLTLSGIVEGTGRPYAVINEAIVGIGESVQGWTLLEVDTGTATLRSASGERVTLRVAR